MSVSGDSVRIVKEVGAPVERVYRAFVDPEELVRWMHPEQFQGVSASNDPRVGGRGELTHADKGGEEVVGEFNWQYLEVEPNRKLVMDWQFGGFREKQSGRTSRMTIELREVDPGRTEVTLFHERLGEAPPGGHLGVNAGWTQALESLAEHLQKGTE